MRGEDSLVRALWAGKPFVWQIYPQDDGAHRAKLEAFLDWLQAPPSLRALHRALERPGPSAQRPGAALADCSDLADWQRLCSPARATPAANRTILTTPAARFRREKTLKSAGFAALAVELQHHGSRRRMRRLDAAA